MTKEQWLEKCAARYMTKGGLDQLTARAAAETCWDEKELNPQDYTDGDDDPVVMADEDMSCWEDDGDDA